MTAPPTVKFGKYKFPLIFTTFFLHSIGKIWKNDVQAKIVFETYGSPLEDYEEIEVV